MKKIKEKIKAILPLPIRKFIYQFIMYLFKNHYRKSYAQCGEDIILDVIFNQTLKGVYVDVGANHQIKSSNTYFFYRKNGRALT